MATAASHSSSSSSSATAANASQSRQPSRPSSQRKTSSISSSRLSRTASYASTAGASWEDEAWAIDSDDEDFVGRQGAPNLSQAAAHAPSSSTGAPSAAPQRHAPPARPHPYPLPDVSQRTSANGAPSSKATSASSIAASTSSRTRASTSRDSSRDAAAGNGRHTTSTDSVPTLSSLSTTRSSEARGGVATQEASTTSSSSAAASPSNAQAGITPGSVGSTRSWTLIDAHAAASAATDGSELGGTSSSPKDTAGAASPEPRIRDNRRSSDVMGEVGAHGRAKKPPGEQEAEAMRQCIRVDLQNLMDDPTNLLASLSLHWNGGLQADGSHPSSPSLNATGRGPQQHIPPTALNGASFAEKVGSPISPDSGRTLTRDEPEGGSAGAAGPTAGNATPGSSRHGARSSVKSISGGGSTRRRLDMDSLLMAGDGVIASTSFGASQTDLGAQSAEDEAAAAALAAAEAVNLERRRSTRSIRKRERFMRCVERDTVDMDELRALAWAGVPAELRPIVWQLLLGYLSPSRAHRAATLARKRADYASAVRLTFQRGTQSLDQAIWHQIRIDVPRTQPGIPLWQREGTQRALERILYVWASRHPASGYVQGINDLATPFFEVFLSAYISEDPEQFDVALLPQQALQALEADTYWCLSKLLDGIQDNYTFAQPGIQRQVRRMGELVARINPPLHSHLMDQGVEYMQFAFRWMNCLLMRELSVQNIVRMWDTYLAEGPDAFSDFHLYVCAVFLSKWGERLMQMDFQGIIMFLQSLPTREWSDKDAEMLLSDAFVKKSWFCGTAHISS